MISLPLRTWYASMVSYILSTSRRTFSCCGSCQIISSTTSARLAKKLYKPHSSISRTRTFKHDFGKKSTLVKLSSLLKPTVEMKTIEFAQRKRRRKMQNVCLITRQSFNEGECGHGNVPFRIPCIWIS